MKIQEIIDNFADSLKILLFLRDFLKKIENILLL